MHRRCGCPVNSSDIPHMRSKKLEFFFCPFCPFLDTPPPGQKQFYVLSKKKSRSGEGHPTCVVLKKDTKTFLLCGFRYFWRPIRCQEHLGLTETSKQVQKCKPYPEHVECSSQVVLEGLLMIVDKVWKLTNTVRVGLDDRSSHTQRQSTFPDNVYSYCPPCHGVFTMKI
jgi:hypothetical protein